MQTQTQTQVRELMGMSVTDTNGAKVGTIKQVYLNDDSGAPEWVTVHTGWFGMRESFLPLSGAHKGHESLQVPYDKETIKGAPNVDADEHLSHAQIVDLYRHYGVRPPGGSRTGDEQETGERAEAEEGAGEEGAGEEGAKEKETPPAPEIRKGTRNGSAKPGAAGIAGMPGAMGQPGMAGMAIHPEREKRMPQQSPREGAETPLTEITRSEERLRVGTERHESGRVHVHRWIETEMVERTVPVTHEEVRVDREPIQDANPAPDAAVSADDQEIILYEERAVITKETVPVERVRVRTERVQDEQTVRGELRKERVEITRDEEPESNEPHHPDQ